MFNGFRSANRNPVAAGGAADAVIVADYCTDFCSDGILKLALRVANRGERSLRDGLRIELYTQDLDGNQTLLEERYTTSTIAIGEGGNEEWFEIDASNIQNGGLMIRVDHTESAHVVLECNETNNLFLLPQAQCP